MGTGGDLSVAGLGVGANGKIANSLPIRRLSGERVGGASGVDRFVGARMKKPAHREMAGSGLFGCLLTVEQSGRRWRYVATSLSTAFWADIGREIC
jgi:hypothetical protein